MFQNSVLKTFNDDEKLVATRWASYQNYKSKVEAIKDFKEEEYQDGFLKDIFESCLGYTLKTTNPSFFNLEREKKNETDSKKADGVFYLNSEIIGVIELKAQDTRNLDKVQQQAFYYLSQHSKAKYVIISNFDELRFYIEKSTAYESFSLFNLSYDEFCKLHLLLAYENIKEEKALKIREKSNKFEQNISKELYKDFSNFRILLFDNLVKNNLSIEKSVLLRLTQKLCDRIIFILFAEDRTLLRANTIKEIREEFINQKFTNYSLYDIYKFYFDAINKGDARLDIPEYNGGLFAVDELLDSLIIDDFILDENVQILSNYDFASEISVNILGHIFEQSLTDLEELQANIDNVNFDKTKSKRKKDGVFYTPEYITRYIVENTLGKMCSEKREELKIVEITPPSNPKKLTKQEQQTKENLQEYKNWLLNLKILDPACGSGAFLNQALEYLISEHKNLQNDLALMGDLFASYMVEEEILEHNLYGVDINEDAVEIAKLSLWLRTAKRGRPLTKLADKIVCANSLLEMPFSENSFDIVIGNPPYVRQEAIKEQKEALSKIYKVANGTADLYVYFYELALNMLKPNGLKGFICSNKFFRAKYGENLREYILQNTTIFQIADFNGVKIFEDATVDSAITIFQKTKSDNNSTFKVVDVDLINSYDMKQSDLTKTSFSFSNPKELAIKQKIEKIGIPLKEWDIKINYGIKTGFNEAFIIDENIKNELIKKDSKSLEIIKPLLRGKDIKKYSVIFANKWLINSHNNPPVNIENYQAIKEHLDQYYDKLEKRSDKGITSYNLRSCAYLSSFEKDKIIYPEIASNPNAFEYDKNGYYLDKTAFLIEGNNLKYIISILNSKSLLHYMKQSIRQVGQGYQLSKIFVEVFPIPKIDEESQKPFIKLVDEILEAKQKIKDYKPLLDEAIKNNNFDREIALKKELENLENICTTNEKTIDQMVYKLYDLTPDEIKIVEGNL
ncbi:Eco57I restriction-modification methylase domain-containing protein [Aliarcobacter thereius]|uniref:site-specific DNA-methyltransferase (adenine-specific) n=1 Tax=Aliarcobacter thereius LMG 24486 TaxID=1032240 RepID=A0A1C7WQN2_9BACT|nr:N-6 DNA methylase [Aliarcobacter thereius]OCL96076.1 Type IIS restriction enzyme Eco57I [Aliarcobacter thereius LMG 24486]QBF15952.1 type IIG restriction endonuclease [Aliarcobacter thereius LMG 24486]TLS94703.1 class I SAM-dependent DNA methyltransferase [Aliarcobacter thereius]